MHYQFQKTLSSAISFKGIGLHTGLISNVKLIPGKDDQGIVFKRVDLEKDNIILANYKNVSSTELCTTLKNDSGISVSTVEHLMAAFYLTGIDNIIVEIDNSEIPIMDGSSKDFIKMIEERGLINLYSKRKYLKILKKLELKENKKFISIEPNDSSLTVDFELGYNNKIIGNQKNYISFDTGNLEDIYSSRTFCLHEDIEAIKSSGLAKGGSLDNAIVIKGEEVLNRDGLRNKKEFVNHKILDLVGDFLLSGYRILGDIKCIQGGHSLSNTFLKEIFKNQSNFQVVSINQAHLVQKEFKIAYKKLAVNA
tara:strand:- start:2312 stop:3238 length:927 start_codon:yes stop_codon:yes gene_type:complete